MGCDIHLHTEIKIAGKWQHLHEPPRIDRWYDMFAYMADVRNEDRDIVPLVKPKGLPKDASEVTKFCCEEWGVDGHSHTWFNADEIRQFCEMAKLKGWMQAKEIHSIEGVVGYLFGNTWEHFQKYRSDYPKEIEDIRWVFWFDN